jgi:hypothetical protein
LLSIAAVFSVPEEGRPCAIDWPGYWAMISMIGGVESGYASMFIVENAAKPGAMKPRG